MWVKVGGGLVLMFVLSMLYMVCVLFHRVLCAENAHLRDNNLRLTAELQRVTRQNGDLSEVRGHCLEYL